MERKWNPKIKPIPLSEERPFRILGLQQIAIGGLDKAALSKLWVEKFGLTKLSEFKSERENVDEDIIELGTGPFSVEVDLMQPLDAEKSPKVHIPALNHIGLWVDDIRAAHSYLQTQGVRFAPGGIRRGAAGYEVCFIHPKGNEEYPYSGEGVLIELVQAPPHILNAFVEVADEIAVIRDDLKRDIKIQPTPPENVNYYKTMEENKQKWRAKYREWHELHGAGKEEARVKQFYDQAVQHKTEFRKMWLAEMAARARYDIKHREETAASEAEKRAFYKGRLRHFYRTRAESYGYEEWAVKELQAMLERFSLQARGDSPADREDAAIAIEEITKRLNDIANGTAVVHDVWKKPTVEELKKQLMEERLRLQELVGETPFELEGGEAEERERVRVGAETPAEEAPHQATEPEK